MVKNKGFTIVELLIVIVVIGILAAITIVAYNGIRTRARTATILSDLNGSVKTLELANVTGGA
jgi:type IV pilus assembly protein PilA